MTTSRAILLAILLLRFSVNSGRAACVNESAEICYGKYPAINGDDNLDSTDDTLDYFQWDFGFVGPSELDRQCTDASIHTGFFNYKPVYFMPQDTVVLDCLNCEMGLDENGFIKHLPSSRFRETGIPKQWYALNEMDFFIAFTGKAQNTDAWTKLHAAMDQINEREKKAGLYSRTMFVQVTGKLYIKDASTYAGGVYICMEENEPFTSHIKPIAYVLMPMLIPSRLEPLLSSTGKVNLGPEMRQEADHRPWHGLNFPLRLPAENASDFVGDQAIYELKPYNLYLQNQWSEWSECTACAPFRGKQLREAHCYLRRSDSYIQTISKSTGYSPDLSFLKDLQEMLDHQPFSSDGVRCWSLPLLLAARQASAANSSFCKLLPNETAETSDSLRNKPWLQRCMAWFYAMFAFDGQNKKTAPFYGHHFEKIPEDYEKGTFEDDFKGIIADTKFFPACGSAGYFIDMRNCVKSNCSNVNYQF